MSTSKRHRDRLTDEASATLGDFQPEVGSKAGSVTRIVTAGGVGSAVDG